MSLMLRRRMLLNSQIETPSLLPKEYQQVEYVEIVNDTYQRFDNAINTDTQFNNADKFEFEISTTDTKSNTMLFCSTKISSPYLYFNNNGSIATDSFVSYSINPDINRNILTNGEIHTLEFNYSATSTNLIRFGAWRDATFSRTIKWYYFKIYQGDVILQNFIPCYRKSDGVIGFYETVLNKFYTNAGTGTFLKGADV